MYNVVESLQLCPTLCDPMHDSLSGSSSVGFSRQEYWNGLPFPPPGHLTDPGIKPESLMSPALAGRLFTTSASWDVQSCLFSGIMIPMDACAESRSLESPSWVGTCIMDIVILWRDKQLISRTRFIAKSSCMTSLTVAHFDSIVIPFKKESSETWKMNEVEWIGEGNRKSSRKLTAERI